MWGRLYCLGPYDPDLFRGLLTVFYTFWLAACSRNMLSDRQEHLLFHQRPVSEELPRMERRRLVLRAIHKAITCQGIS